MVPLSCDVMSLCSSLLPTRLRAVAMGVLRFPSDLKGSQGLGVALESHIDALTINLKGALDAHVGHPCVL